MSMRDVFFVWIILDQLEKYINAIDLLYIAHIL